ncbi:hypothetical protein [Escherichia coli]|nr:hypothetical protein [Escherichia coli]
MSIIILATIPTTQENK